MKKLMVTGGLGFIGSYFVDLALPPSVFAQALRPDTSHKAMADRDGFVLSFRRNRSRLPH